MKEKKIHMNFFVLTYSFNYTWLRKEEKDANLKKKKKKIHKNFYFFSIYGFCVNSDAT